MGAWCIYICTMVNPLGHQIPTEELQNNIRVYRDDGLAILRDQPRQVEKTKKAICKIFKSICLGITIQANKKINNFLDITLNLVDATHKPFNKPGNTPICIHQNSNPPPSIIRNIPKSINKRLSMLSSDKENFNSEAQIYQNALKRVGTTSHYNMRSNKHPVINLERGTIYGSINPSVNMLQPT